jgi:hypothetical protein
MSFVDKLKFWKKDDDFTFDDPLPQDMSTMPQDNLGLDSSPNDDLLSSPPGEFNPGATVTDDLGTADLEKMGFEKVTDSPSSRSSNPMSTTSQQQSQIAPQNRDMELISSKLDTIKAELDAMSQRLQKIEKLAEDDSDKKKRVSW